MAGAAATPHLMPVDKGYAWAICAGSAVLFFVTMGVTKSLGVMLLEFQDHFGSDPGLTSLTVALVAAGFFMFVFSSNTLGLFLGNRVVAIGGSTLASISMLVTAFSPNIYFVVVFLGLLSGIAYSAMFGPPLVILSAYFKDRRALATGLAVAGGSVGQLVIPLLLDFLINSYGFQGGLLIFSGILLHAVPAAIVLCPPAWWSRKPVVETIHKTPCCTRFTNVLKVMLDKELLRSSLFYTLLASIILGHMGYFGAVIFFPSAAYSFFGDRRLSVIMVSVMGFCDLVGRMMGGYLADLRILKINDLMGISLLVPGLVTILAGIFPSVWLMFIAAIFIGAFAGSYTALLTPVIIEYFGLAKVSPGFGIITLLMGVFIAPWPTAMAYIVKAAQTYKVMLGINGSLMAAGGVLFFIQRFVVKKAEQKKQTEKSMIAAAELVDAQTDDAMVKLRMQSDVNQNGE